MLRPAFLTYGFHENARKGRRDGMLSGGGETRRHDAESLDGTTRRDYETVTAQLRSSDGIPQSQTPLRCPTDAFIVLYIHSGTRHSPEHHILLRSGISPQYPHFCWDNRSTATAYGVLIETINTTRRIIQPPSCRPPGRFHRGIQLDFSIVVRKEETVQTLKFPTNITLSRQEFSMTCYFALSAHLLQANKPQCLQERT
ncbi:hypothetical protein E2P81_ATG02663 [Venturia nashicola]|nr:hypothetical protein E2P81_ATG02663 [Venturia nashicola]